MVNYNYSKIYKITNSINNDFYIGSTTNQYLCSRMNCHRMASKENNGRRESNLYKLMRELGVKNFKIELLEEVKCDNKIDLCNKEQYYIDLLKPTLNMTNPKHWTKEKIKEYKNDWWINKQIKEGKEIKPKKSKEQIAEERKEYKKNWYLKHRKEDIMNRKDMNKWKDENFVKEYKKEWIKRKRECLKTKEIIE